MIIWPGQRAAAKRNRALASEGSFGNLDSAALANVFAVCGALYLAIYALESPIRYLLYLQGKDSLILLRDALILVPVAALLTANALQLRLHPAFLAFGLLTAFHGLVLVGTVGSVVGAAYGVKIVINLLFGYFAASLLATPGRSMLRFMALLWVVTLVGLCLDKFLVTFPWTGIKTIVGDLSVDVSKDWQIQDSFERRVAGFTRSSISAAALIPILAIILAGATRNRLLRAFVVFSSLGAVFLTTQKGALAAFVPIAAVLALRPRNEIAWMRACCLGLIAVAAALPVLTLGLHFTHGAGVFSTESLTLRISDTWPQAMRWIARHQMLGFGVGLGGIGGPQRLYAPDSFNPADNFFILLYAYFGVFALIYVAIVCWLVFRPVTGSKERAATAIALVAFAFGDGAVLSIIEDQAAALFLGAALGVLCRETARRPQPAALWPVLSPFAVRVRTAA